MLWGRQLLVRVVAAIFLVWLAVGVYGSWSYVHDYYVYLGFGAPRDPPGVPKGILVTERFYSKALRQTDAYRIYLPAGYSGSVAAGQRYPVLYLLHGSPGRATGFTDVARVGVEMDTLLAQRRIHPFLL